MRMEDVPDLQSAKYEKRISVALTKEQHAFLQERLKRQHRKDPCEFIRMLLDKAMRELAVQVS